MAIASQKHPASAAEGTGALEKALDVLEAIGRSPQGMSQADLAKQLALPRTTVYRLLATLVARGLLRRDQQRRVYCIGVRCYEMARQSFAVPDLVAAAAIELRTLRDITGETTYLARLDGTQVLSLERCDGAHSKRSAASLGDRKPLHCTSQGKAILAAMPDAQRDAMVRDIVLRPMTALTITDRRRLQAELRITRARGYAIDDEEILLGVRCVGAPIVDSAGDVRGAVSVAGPAWRLTRERLELLGPEVAEAARRIGAQLAAQRPAVAGAAESNVQALPGNWAFQGAHPVVADDGRVFWADVLAPTVRCLDEQGDKEIFTADAPIAGLLLRAGNPIVVHGQGATQLPTAAAPALALPWPQGTTLAACTDAQGAIWAAMSLPESGSAIGQVQESGRLRVHWRIGEAVASLAVRRADGAVFAAAPHSGAIFLFTPGQSAVRRLASVARGSGRLGGLAPDAQGGVWAALSDGWSVVRFTMDGQLERVIGLPVPCATDVALRTRAGRQELLITTQRQSVPLDALASAPLSGRLLLATL